MLNLTVTSRIVSGRVFVFLGGAGLRDGVEGGRGWEGGKRGGRDKQREGERKEGGERTGREGGREKE